MIDEKIQLAASRAEGPTEQEARESRAVHCGPVEQANLES